MTFKRMRPAVVKLPVGGYAMTMELYCREEDARSAFPSAFVCMAPEQFAITVPVEDISTAEKTS